ncbi:MinD/ParA family ATP-binding protein [Nocardia sp. NPDC003345]
MGEDWSRWLDTAPDSGAADEADGTGRASVVRLRGEGRVRAAGAARPILVVGGCGGAGTTTTALGLAGELGLGGTDTVAVDATPAGGDLALRGADEHLHPISLQQWLYGRGDDEPAPLKECMSRATSGIGLLWRDAAPLRRRASYLTVARAVDQAGYTGVYDGGNPIASRQLRPLLDDADIALVLAIPARTDAANRLRVTLEWLDDEYDDAAEPMGGGIVGDTTIVISHQQPGADSRVAEHLREHLSGWVREIVEVPYDPHLARGELVRHLDLAAETRQAYETLLAGMSS